MPRFKVRCFNAGEWDGIEPQGVDAQNEQAAAEHVCGEPLIDDAGKPGQFRVEVWPEAIPWAKKLFYALLPLPAVNSC